jgi:site-specific recombinase XerD
MSEQLDLLRGQMAATTAALVANEKAVDRRGRPLVRSMRPGFRAGIKPRNAGRSYPPTPPTPAEVYALMDACSSTSPAQRRWRAMIAVTWRSALRVSELLDLVDDDLDEREHTLVVRCGKNGKRRVVGMDAGGWEELRPWLTTRDRLVKAPTRTFCVVEGPTKGLELKPEQFRVALRHLARQAGVRKRIAPHQLRHAAACEMAREGMPIHVVSRQLGHSNIGTTDTYLRGIANEEVVEAVAARPRPEVRP